MTQQPFSFQQQQLDLKRKQMLADILQQKALQPGGQGQMVDGHYISPGLVGAVTPLLSAMMAKKAQSGVDTQRQDLETNYNNALQQSLQDYMKRRETDPEGAARQAMSSEFQPLQAIATDDLKALREGMIKSKDILNANNFDPASRINAIRNKNDISLLQEENKPIVVNGQLVQKDSTGGFKTALDARDQFGAVGTVGYGADGRPIAGQLNTKTNEAKFAPGGINVDTTLKAGNAFGVELSKKRAEILAKSYDNALAATKAIESIGSAGQDLEAGIKSGAAAPVSLAMAKWGKALGMQGVTPEIANTESFRANMARETMQLVKNLGSGTAISNTDREFAEKASGGDITLDDRAMLRLMNIAKAASGNVMVEHNRLLDASKDATGALPQDLEVLRLPDPLGEVSDKPIPGQVYRDPKTGKYLVAPAEDVPTPEQAALQAQPSAVDSGMPVYRLEDWNK